MTHPYPGLRPYVEAESDIFYGQDGALQALLERLNSQHFVTLLGLSGCGKSSLLNAGLLANIRSRLVDGGNLPRWLIVTMRPGCDPLENLERELELCFPSLPVRTEIERDTSGLERLISGARLHPGQRVLIVVDQFEELFRYRRSGNSAESEDKASYFVKLLLQTRRAEVSQIYILLAMRSEFLGDCSTFYGLAEQVNSGTFLLPKMTRDHLEEAIVGPLDDLNVGVEQTLVQLLLNESEDEDDGLPLLQHALRRTWETRQHRAEPQTPLRIDDFRSFRRPPSALGSLVKQHLNDHLDSIYLDLTPGQQLAAERLFRALSERDGTGRAVRRPLPYDQLLAQIGPEVEAVLEAFRNIELGRTFLMPPSPDKLPGATVDISHECLLRRWDLLKGWVEAEAQDAKNFVSLAEEADAADLQEKKTGSRKPLAGATLDKYQTWHGQAKPTAGWAQRYEGPFDAQLQRPLRQFDAAMRYLDWSVKLRCEEDAKDQANRTRIARLKILNWSAGLAIVLLLVGMYVTHLFRQSAEQVNLLKKQADVSSKKADNYKNLAGDISNLAQEGLSRSPSDARDVLQGVIALSAQTQAPSPSPTPVAEGWIYLGTIDNAGRTWLHSDVSDALVFDSPVAKDQPILSQLADKQIHFTIFINLREDHRPHADGAITKVLRPGTPMKIVHVGETGRSGRNVWVQVDVVK